ncbi:chromosomal replication initiator DnaA [Sedimentitalea sp. HM32M-2]|uniref:chromosomal replication initiator DnaA n=1 Tax=Sedimentitalea sp. HM32M-2 TaxID=3351566 RepID=UPI00363A8CF0
MAEQLSFDLPAKPVLGRDDFFVSPANALAVAMIDSPATWPQGRLVLTGPAGSGKTHLAHVWADATGARILAARDLADCDVAALAQGPVAVEDVPAIARDPAAQNALFHLHNLLTAGGFRLLMTGRRAPNLWDMSLPDLQSRVQGATHMALQAPDDRLLAAVMAKLFADRQITPKPDVIPYLLHRMDRSFRAATNLVLRLDQAALAQKRTLSRRLAAELLGEADNNE